MVIYSNARRHDGKLHITYHPYFCAVRYAVDVDPFFGELFVKIHGDESYFETAEHIPMTASRAHMIPSICPSLFLNIPQADVRGIEQPIAIQILKTHGAMSSPARARSKQLKGVSPPLIRLWAQNHHIFFRDHGDYLKIERVLDRKEAYADGLRSQEDGALRPQTRQRCLLGLPVGRQEGVQSHPPRECQTPGPRRTRPATRRTNTGRRPNKHRTPTEQTPDRNWTKT